jgi:hypothetical protein
MTKSASSASLEFIRQRRAVYHGLCSVLTEPEAAAALVAWTAHFSAQDSAFSGLNSFVRDVSSSFDKVELQRELLHAISRALVSREEDLRPVPMMDGQPDDNVQTLPPAVEIANPVVADADAEGRIETPEFRTFCALLSTLLQLVDHQHAEFSTQLRLYIKEVINDLPWSEAQQEQLIKFIDIGSTVQTRAYREGQLKALFGHLKVWMEEKLERKSSAGIIERAMTEVGRMEVGHQYSPKLFF